ncbi:uncharacterized protein DUF1572 [Kordia periserrulae]|uniref:Uncharacterized protein DUF1572 n=1 Tax=Kordia periserrulae TaxID=701523 RepID=A0A2T6C0U4_9FLAO|nr:DUF1572 family protein [Kordia periserrulae]PTX61935.1 uncharacterized protein DUF1572 [Kordia periserrulae]
MKASLIKLFDREIDRLHYEIEQYKDETALWKVEKNISNCSGNLCLHLIGNLNHFIGNIIGNTGYIRQRDLEFSTKNTPKATLLQEVSSVKEVVITALSNFPEEKLQDDYPIEKDGEKPTYELMLLHLLWHLSYHVGQINYHRRLLDS